MTQSTLGNSCFIVNVFLDAWLGINTCHRSSKTRSPFVLAPQKGPSHAV